jgi:hypothetical protein
MGLFGPKKPCPNCGHNVKEPQGPSDFLCPKCDQPGPWASADQIATWHTQQAARASYEVLLDQLAAGAEPSVVLTKLNETMSTAEYEPKELLTLNVGAINRAAALVLADDLISPAEDARLAELTTALNVTWQQVGQIHPELPPHLLIAEINGGLLPQVTSPHVIARKGEIVHIEVNASLMKEVAVRQYQGGYSGFSIPLGKTGVRYRVGATRGHSVEVGTQMNVADSGMLSVTNKRVIYSGSRKTVEMTLAKLVNLSAFSDGLIFHPSNRVNAVIVKIPRGAEVVAAIVNAAAQRVD